MLILLLLTVLFISEELTHFVEITAGRYLAAHNSEREPYGTTWEKERKARIAARMLSEGLAAGSKLRDATDRAETLADLVDVLPNDGSVQVSPSKFVSLYMSLPKSSRDRLIPSIDLLDFYYNSEWIRTSVSLENDAAIAHFVDGQNHVFHSVPLPDDLIRVASTGGRRIVGGLDDDPRFIGRLHTSERFFAILFQLSEQERTAIFPDPEMLLGLPKPVNWVGLAPAGGEPFAQAGFESVSPDGPVINIYPISVAAFDRLSFLLAWADSDTLFREREPPDQPSANRGRNPL